MGCASSSPAGASEPAEATSKAEEKTPEPVAPAQIDVEEVKNNRISIRYVAPEIDQKAAASSNNLVSNEVPTFDRKKIGTSTKHGVMPAPRGGSLAKINQDRGVICFPFHGSFNEALLCVFDGHGPKGEKASDFCINTLPGLLE